MITDEQLEAQLNEIRESAPESNAKFQSVETFKQKFFARVKEEQKKAEDSSKTKTQPEKQPSPWDVLRRIIHPRKPTRTHSSVAAAAFAPPLFASFEAEKCYCHKAMSPCVSYASAIDSDSIPFDLPVGNGLPENFNTDEYGTVTETPFVASARNPLSTFGADVDTAGYTNARRMIMENDCLPPENSIRVDEFINYFRYKYPLPAEGDDIRPHFEYADAPWATGHKLLLVGIQARDIEKDKLPPSNYVFIIDNSGSMDHVFNMVKEAMSILTRQLRTEDKVSIVTYGGEVRTILEGSSDSKAILEAIAKLNCNGYTPGGEAIQQAYKLAHTHFVKGGNNRIVLITDGDFNVGASSEADLTAMVEKERGAGIYLSVVGCGFGNYKDNRMKMLANKGDGNYIYIDSISEARRAFTQGLTGQMFTIAHDLKFQVEFNPANVYAYRLIGYELRRMADTDFRDDTKDSGEVGVGQQVTALYDIIPNDAPASVKSEAVPDAPALRYSTVAAIGSDELLTFSLRYQKPDGGGAVEKEYQVAKAEKDENIGWATAVAGFGLLLRDSKYKGNATFKEMASLAKANIGPDMDEERLEFITMVKRASDIAK